MNDEKDDDQPLLYHDLERSEYPVLKANVTGTGTTLDLTEEMFVQAAHDFQIAMERMSAQRREVMVEWLPIISWLIDSQRDNDAARLSTLIGMAIEMGPPFVVNSSGHDFMQEMWKQYQDREQEK